MSDHNYGQDRRGRRHDPIRVNIMQPRCKIQNARLFARHRDQIIECSLQAASSDVYSNMYPPISQDHHETKQNLQIHQNSNLFPSLLSHEIIIRSIFFLLVLFSRHRHRHHLDNWFGNYDCFPKSNHSVTSRQATAGSRSRSFSTLYKYVHVHAYNV
jgi:hypothetical protein